MILNRSSTRYAHIPGFTYCSYTEKGDSIITCGADGDIRRWQGIDDDDPISKCLGETIHSVAQYDDHLLACTNINAVYDYHFPDLVRNGIIFRFVAPATCIKTNAKFIAAGSEDSTIKILKRNENELEFECNDHEGPILQIDIGVKDMLASASGDGTLKIWDLIEKKNIKTITGFNKVTSFESADCYITPSFYPQSGDYLAYCSDDEIIVLKCTNWDVKVKLKHDEIEGKYSCCAFSFNGEYLAAGTTNGEVVVFHFTRKWKSYVNNMTSDTDLLTITSIAWNPQNNNEFVYCDSAGHLGSVYMTDPNEKNEINASYESDTTKDNCLDDYAIEDDKDEGDENCISLEKLKNETYRDFDTDADNNDEDKVLSQSTVGTNVERHAVNIFRRQPPFQPSATPDTLEHRYMVWNHIGIITAHKDDGYGSIDIEFHDTSLHHTIHMNNYLHHSLASLSSTVVALAAYGASKLVCITLGASGSREWSTELPDLEEILAVTATDKLVSVASNKNLVRIFTVMGTQREVISIPGPVIAMAGDKNKIMIAYHSAPASEDQHISAMILQTANLTLKCRDIRIPITSESVLTWIGFSDMGSPLCYDKTGILKMYNMKTNCWYPICDTTKNTSEYQNNFFVVHALESTQVVQGIACRGCPYPMTTPRPLLLELPMQIPLCDIESDKSVLEEQIIRLTNFPTDDAKKTITESSIKLFSLACRTEMEARAKELIEMIGSTHVLSLAVKYASKIGRIHLADKLAELLPDLEKNENEIENEMKKTEADFMNTNDISFSSENLTLMSKSKTPSTPCNSPYIVPKPLIITSSIKRNPFKKTISANHTLNNNSQNPLSHLTGNIIGYNDKINNSQSEQQTPESQDILTTITSSSDLDNSNSKSLNDENDEIPPTNDSKKKSNKGNFNSWYKENKETLRKSYPEANDNELAKIALKDYRKILNEEGNDKTIKRKLDDSSEDKQSGISKLAKFGFTKN